jgi:cation-transporting ATPase 13A1
VRRDGRWISVSALDIVPGDVISVVKGPENNNIVPCDCLIISGSAIVNEASLTGPKRVFVVILKL